MTIDRTMTMVDHTLDRVLDAYLVRVATSAGATLGATPEMALVFLLLWRIDADGTGAGARAISVNAVAASLDRPYETMRRRIRRLADADLCEVTIRGVAIGDAPAGRAAIRRLEPELAAAFAALLAAIPAASARGIPLPAGGGETGPARVAAALDLLLAIADCRRACDRDWTDTVIAAAIAAGDVVAPLPHGDTIHGVARRLGLPYATTWRHVRALAVAGRLIEHAGRYSRAPVATGDADRQGAAMTLAGRTRALLARLVAAEGVAGRRVA